MFILLENNMYMKEFKSQKIKWKKGEKIRIITKNQKPKTKNQKN